MSFKHTGTIEIQTERLLLRRFTYDDAEDMLRNWIADPMIQNNYGEPTYETKEVVLELLAKWINQYPEYSFYRWAIILKDNSENIGQIAFCRVYTDIETAELEYCIGQKYWGHGYAAEALNSVIQFSFEYPQFSKLEAFHRINNPRSGRVLQKSKMKIVDNVKRFELVGKVPDGEICYAITGEEYYAK